MTNNTAHPPYDQWFRLDNHLTHCPPFNYQYLAKVGNIDHAEAIHFKRDISPWQTPFKGDYHRRYEAQNPLLKQISEEIAKRIGLKNGTLFLITNRELFEYYCPFPLVTIPTTLPATQIGTYFEAQPHQGAIIQIEGQLALLYKGDVEPVLLFIAERGFTPTLQESAQAAANLALFYPNETFHLPKQETPLDFPQFLERLGPFSDWTVVDLSKDLSNVDSMGRVLHYLGEAKKIDCSVYENLQRFENYLELVHEEIILWLMEKKPYGPGELETLIGEKLKAPLVRTMRSGMECFSTILKMVLKENSTLLCYDDCYFETIEILKSLKNVTLHLVKYPEIKTNIDILFIDFHHNFVLGKTVSQKHDVAAIIRQTNPKTVIIDNTIGYIHSEEINALLKEFPPLTFIVYWSHQKFDQFGIDKFSGGTFCVYSQNELEAPPSTIDPISRQGLTHYFAHAANKMEQWRKKIFENARYVNEHVRKEFRLIRVVPKLDDQIFSVDVQFQWDPTISRKIVEAFWKRGVPLMYRPSFGYSLTTCSFFLRQAMRFSIGTEKKEHLDQFIAAFNDIFEQLDEELTKDAERLALTLQDSALTKSIATLPPLMPKTIHPE